MSALQTLSLISIAVGTVAILRFIWLDSLRFADRVAEAADSSLVSPQTVRRLATQVESARVHDENESLPRAA